MSNNSILTLDSIRDIKIYQSRDGYRFSVDALLLFSFVNLQRVKRIVDIGAGSGIIGILLAKKYSDAEVLLIEIQGTLASLSIKNIELNGLKERIKIINGDVRKVEDLGLIRGDYDLIVSNPPFRRINTGLVSNIDEKAIARHEIKLSLNDLMKASSYLLRHHGRLCIIYLPERLVEIIDVMRSYGLEPKRFQFVHSKALSEAKMVLIEAVKGGSVGLKVDRPFFIYNEDGSYTDEMKKIYEES